MIAIGARGVTKDFRRISRKRRMASLKSALLSGRLRRSLQPDQLFRALHGVDLEISRGEFLGIIGSNGSGKSTLLKLMAGIVKPTLGQLEITGRVSALLELGAGFHPEISGRENVLINGIMLGLTRDQVRARFDRIVEFSGLGEFIDEPVKNYSSGMYVRLGFAVAVHTDPEILLVDEVLAVGDEEFSHRCLARIREMHRSGVTIVLVTHSLGLVSDLCDRAVWLDQGKIAAAGDPREVVDRYRLAVARDEGTSRLSSAGEFANEDDPDLPPREDLREMPPDSGENRGQRTRRRWGDGQVEIRRVALRSGASPDGLLECGHPAELQLRIDAVRPVEDLVVGFAIHDLDGRWILGTNTDLEGFHGRGIRGPGAVSILVESLDLVPGDYDLDVAVHARDGRPYDYIRSAIRFHVTGVAKEVGCWRARRSWSFEGPIDFGRSG